MAQIGIINENLMGDVNYFDSNTEFTYTSGVTMTNAPSYEYISARTRKVDFSNANDKLYLTKSLDAGTYALSFYAKFGDDASYVLNAKNSSGTVLESTETFSSATVVNDNEWTKITLEFTLETADAVTFELIAQSAGVIYLNGIMLGNSEEYMPATYNLLYNGGFENGLDGWTVSPVDCFAVTTNSDVKFGNKAVSAVGSVMEEYTVSTEYDVDSTPPYSYILSGWAKAESLNNIGSRAAFELYAKVEYSYTNSENVLISAVKETKIPFSADTTEWQYVSGVVEMPSLEEGQTLLRIDSIELGGRYANNANTIIFDNLALVCDTAITIDYDENGNMSGVSVDNEDLYTYEYDEDDNLIKIISVDGSYTEYEYTDGNLTAVYDVDTDGVRTLTEQYTYYDNDFLHTGLVDGVSTSYEYTSWGVTNKQTTSRTIDETLYKIVSEALYDNNTKKLVSETDSLGNTTSYEYNTDLWLTLITDANGNKTRYEYLSGNLSKEYADINKNGVWDEGESFVGYTYGVGGRITGISTETTSYAFTYNNANLLQSVYVAGEETPLITYLYNSNYTENTGVSYANGLTVSYVRDTIGNIRKDLHNGVVKAEYEYDTNMNMILSIDETSITNYNYSDNGELNYVSKSVNGYTIFTYSMVDEESGEVEYVTEIDGTAFVYKSVYDDESDMSSYIISNLAGITSDTDDWGRTKNVYLKDSEDNNILTCTYTYVNKQLEDGLVTSEYISSITYTNGYTYSYTYDAVGNITSVSDGSNTTTYEYDSLYQLIRENNESTDTTWTYTYDSAGNILSKNEYAYSTGTLGTAIDTVTYTYGNTNWGDQLTSYDGTTIIYDDQGNPVNWREGMVVTWDKNRIININNNDADSSYFYDKNGLLTKRTAYGDWIDYFWDNGKLIAEFYCDGEEKQYYLYDKNGSPLGWQYIDDGLDINTYFYYIKNQQGDILGFVDEYGRVVAEYEYDAWGNLTYISSNFDGIPIAEYNSLRYRGYFYDIYSELYFIGDNYYDPSLCRFVNTNIKNEISSCGSILDYNIYSFCENNPISNVAIVLSNNSVVQDYKPYSDCYILYDVPIYCQNGYQLCWAFCQIMIEHYYDKSLQFTEDSVNAAIALSKSIYGEFNWNRGGEPTNIKQKIVSTEIVSPRQLYNLLKEHGPVYGYYVYTGNDLNIFSSSHLIVITGVNVLTGMVYTNNPWGNKNVQSFNDFQKRLLHPNLGYMEWGLSEYWLVN